MQITAHAFHTRLVDSYNGKICTEVFQVRYTKLDGQKYYLLGLRDFTEPRVRAMLLNMQLLEIADAE
eukprot:g18107.t1